MAPRTFDIQIEGLDDLRRLLRNDAEDLIGKPYRELMQQSAKVGEQRMEAAAPRETGQLRSSIRSRVPRSPRPRYVTIEATARRRSRRYPRGYPYPKWLEYSPGSPHRGWAERTAQRQIAPRMQGELTAFIRKVERRWSAA